jgi:hypothetical protein
MLLHKLNTQPSLLKIRPYLRFVARKAGYELVGEGKNWGDLLGYKLFPRKLPESLPVQTSDPYYQHLSISISSVTSRVGFSYAKDGWHPFVQTLEEYAYNSKLRYEDSTLARLYSLYRPSNVQEVLLDHIQRPVKPLCDWPPYNELISRLWALSPHSLGYYLNLLKNKPQTDGWIFFGPHTQEYGEREFHRLISVYNSIKQNGYQPELTDLDPVNGYFLKKENNYRFVLLQGNHRVSALKALGYSEVKVLIRQGHPAVVDYAKLHRWTEENGGIYPSQLIEKLFDALYNESGLQKALRYGLTD